MEFHPLTTERFSDFETLFGPKGACGGCWCMYHRLTNAEFGQLKGEGAHLAMQALVDNGAMPGVLAYDDGAAIGWCSIAPRQQFPRFERARVYRPVDDKPVWSISCLFIAKEFRRKGVGSGLIRAAVQYAADNGATIVEAYPVEPQKENMPDVFAFTGIASAFLKEGFVEVARPTPTRPVMRRYV